MQQYIMVYGNPVDGFYYVGPFVSHDAAAVYMENSREDCWIADLDGPALKSHKRGD